jgi:hypothetical protein
MKQEKCSETILRVGIDAELLSLGGVQFAAEEISQIVNDFCQNLKNHEVEFMEKISTAKHVSIEICISPKD